MKSTILSVIPSCPLLLVGAFSMSACVMGSQSDIHGVDHDNTKPLAHKASITHFSGSGPYQVGDTVTVAWDFLLCGCDWTADSLDIDLYRNGRFYREIANGVPFYGNSSKGIGEYEWDVFSFPADDDYQIKLYDSEKPSNDMITDELELEPTSSGCHDSSWSLSPTDSYTVIPDNSTRTYSISEVGIASYVKANSAAIEVMSYEPLIIEHAGVDYFTPGYGQETLIPITPTSSNCGLDPSIVAELRFKNQGSPGNGVYVYMGGVSSGHDMADGNYDFLSIY